MKLTKLGEKPERTLADPPGPGASERTILMTRDKLQKQ